MPKIPKIIFSSCYVAGIILMFLALIWGSITGIKDTKEELKKRKKEHRIVEYTETGEFVREFLNIKKMDFTVIDGYVKIYKEDGSIFMFDNFSVEPMREEDINYE